MVTTPRISPIGGSEELMRFYENVFPAQDEYVMVQVERITESGAYVRLLEYGLEGLIQFNEISRRKVKTVTNIIRVGKTEICIVLSVDKEKGKAHTQS